MQLLRTRPRTIASAPKPVVEVLSRAELAFCRRWASAFAGQRKDRRFYELVEDTIRQGFDYRYFALKNEAGEVCAIQPFFIIEQDILAGAGRWIGALVAFVRRLWPRFMSARTLMVGCAAGEGRLDGDESSQAANARLLAAAIVAHARRLKARLIVLKEFPAKYRATLACFLEHGFHRAPSLPMTSLDIDYASFEDYMKQALNSATRAKLRKKFAAAAQGSPLEMSVLVDAAPIVDEIYPLYLAVYRRSKLRFEKLTKEYFCGIGRRMPDKVRFFVWRQDARIVAFTLCMLDGSSIVAEYVGLDYSVALDLHLYHCAIRDMISWGIANGYKRFRSTSLNYDPKLHLRCLLDPLDLYVRHTSRLCNLALKWALPLLEPTRYDETLRKFPNYGELWFGPARNERRGR